MKRIKEYDVDTVICAMLTSSIIVPTFITYFVAYRSGFAQAYNETVQRNVQRILDTKYDWIKYFGYAFHLKEEPLGSQKVLDIRGREIAGRWGSHAFFHDAFPEGFPSH